MAAPRRAEAPRAICAGDVALQGLELVEAARDALLAVQQRPKVHMWLSPGPTLAEHEELRPVADGESVQLVGKEPVEREGHLRAENSNAGCHDPEHYQDEDH